MHLIECPEESHCILYMCNFCIGKECNFWKICINLLWSTSILQPTETFIYTLYLSINYFCKKNSINYAIFQHKFVS